MATSKKSQSKKCKLKNWTLSKQEYKEIAKQREPSRTVFKNSIRAFVSGGTICLIGQAVEQTYMTFCGMNEKQASNPTVVTLILLSVILTCCGVYDKIGQWAGAGSAVPITGFANSMCSAALEHRSEGLVLGVGGNMFKLAGSVIVFGTVAAFVVALVYLLFGLQH